MINLANALITKLTISNVLDKEDLAALRQLPIRERNLGPHEVVVADGSKPTDCCVLLSGFACRAKVTPDDRRQVLSLHIPGEIPDLQSLHLHVMDHELVTITPCRLGFISHEAVKFLNASRPSVASALWRETLIDAAIFREWIVNVGSRPALARLAHLLLELLRRLESIGNAKNDEFTFPITQADLGDCLGVSAVHVNRVMQELRRMDLVEVQRNDFRILQREALETLAGFNDSYLHLSSSS